MEKVDQKNAAHIQLNSVEEGTELPGTRSPPHNYSGLEYKGTPPHPEGTQPVDAEPIELPPPGPEVDPEKRRSRRSW